MAATAIITDTVDFPVLAGVNKCLDRRFHLGVMGSESEAIVWPLYGWGWFGFRVIAGGHVNFLCLSRHTRFALER